MQLLTEYKFPPGCCFSCRMARPGKVVLLQQQDPNTIKRNMVYLCWQCVTAMWDMLEPDKVLVPKQKIADLEGENIALTNEVTRLIDEATSWEIKLAQALRSTADA